ncbi:hypothetical protein FBY39_1895 [Microbacterium sp. SLBN-146]|nr:hypothetical protein FBY39_1895 [Microbacterium sp. SLBN-146]
MRPEGPGCAPSPCEGWCGSAVASFGLVKPPVPRCVAPPPRRWGVVRRSGGVVCRSGALIVRPEGPGCAPGADTWVAAVPPWHRSVLFRPARLAAFRCCLAFGPWFVVPGRGWLPRFCRGILRPGAAACDSLCCAAVTPFGGGSSRSGRGLSFRGADSAPRRDGVRPEPWRGPVRPAVAAVGPVSSSKARRVPPRAALGRGSSRVGRGSSLWGVDSAPRRDGMRPEPWRGPVRSAVASVGPAKPPLYR